MVLSTGESVRISDSGAGDIVFIDFGEAFDNSLISPADFITIEELRGKLENAYSNVYETFATALRIHDEWEKYYIENMDFAKADQIALELIQELYAGHESDTPTASRHLFSEPRLRGSIRFYSKLDRSAGKADFHQRKGGLRQIDALKSLPPLPNRKESTFKCFIAALIRTVWIC